MWPDYLPHCIISFMLATINLSGFDMNLEKKAAKDT